MYVIMKITLNKWVVVQDWHNTIFWIKDPDPYPITNGGQT